ncbi:U11/U12 small nuclear ribonucleoprotein 25 kDa protein [Sesamum indicum]|uniref:U11/U12 small nuclear ribonucleoprotein 25 kDa protein n=1 Tax=Sesamum indicum TaxID=4182 RepID=A0A6I9TJZ3_SESIN|nr:U11/U12 small nuclear ribonucleoprotein 25 kDa protein [Sesamum indicum]XP_011083409.1 U11/U12 small nuclear ribonucleoprotein 25 kDa protein [Sesamum indicum]XP_020551168.1 U11/U12 small nuclear ribonucleoprotein 25 kDa protein [Sesamum indicum]
MDALTDDKKAGEAGTSTTAAVDTPPEYSNSSVKKARLQSTLTALLTDPILADVPKKPSLSDVDTLINLELGSAMRITVLKLDGTSLEVAVMNSATVKDLKLAIKKKVNDMEESRMGHRHISWKHVWANFCLSYLNEKLLDDNAALQHYGVRNNSQVQFVPYVVARASRKHSRRRKHRFFHGLNRKA